MDFEIGDWVVYTPYIEGIASAKKRKHDHGIITSVLNDYVILKFNYSVKLPLYILKIGISHAPYSPKAIKALFRPCLQQIKELVSAREARRVMLERTPFSVRLPGPAHLVQEFITNVKRSKVNLKMLAEA
jgi:hypothetical protein